MEAVTEYDSLTNGSIVRPILALSLPTLAGNVLQSTFSIIDLYFIGRVGTEAIAAVSVAGTIMMLIITGNVGIGIGSTALVSRYSGGGETEKLRRAIGSTIALAAIFSLFIAIGGPVLARPIIGLMGTEAVVVDIALAYITVLFVGGFTMIFMMLISAVIRGTGDAVTPMIVLAVAVAINIGLDPVLIFGLGPFPEMGATGAAVATVVARGVGFIVLAVILTRRFKPLHPFNKRNYSLKLASRIITIGIPASIQMLTRSFAGVILIGIVAAFGTAAVAAYGIGTRITMLMLMPGFAFAVSAAILVGRNLGAGKSKRAERSAWTTAFIYLGVLTALVIALMAAPKFWVGIFDDARPVVDLGALFVYIVAPSFFLLPFGMVLGRSMSGAGVSFPPMVVTVSVLLGVRIPLAFILAKFAGLGAVGVFWAVAIPTAMEGIIMMFLFRTGIWKHKKL
jgi:putative MATE family efflux protein